MITSGTPERTQGASRSPQDQMAQLRKAMMGVVSEGGTAAGAAIKGVSIAGKTGTAQTLQVRQERQAALPRVVRRLGAGRTIRRSSSSSWSRT